MPAIHRKGKQLDNVWSFDQVYAGVPADQHCQCGHTASLHLVTFRRTSLLAIKCDDCVCNAYFPVVELSVLNGRVPDASKA